MLKIYFLGRNFESQFWTLEQPINNKGCSSIQFFLRKFYQKYKKVLLNFFYGARKFLKVLRFLGAGKFYFLNYKKKFFWVDFLIFCALAQNVAQVASYTATEINCTYLLQTFMKFCA